MAMMQHAAVAYEPGLVRLGEHTYTYLQPDGGFGLSNAGVIAGGDGAALIDTFFDLPSTRRLLDAVHTEIKQPLRTVVNTHSNGDHCWGNQLVADAEIVAHRICAEEMGHIPPALMQAARAGQIEGKVGAYLKERTRPFDFRGIELTLPTATFEDDLTLDVGGTEAHLVYVGPAHTGGDVIIHVPSDGVVFAGDIVFNNCHPLAWDGTIDSWIAALRQIEALDPAILVPGHGPVSGPEGATQMREYLEFVKSHGAEQYERGVSLRDAAAVLDLGPYASWGEPERVVHNLARAYKEGGADLDHRRDMMEVFSIMAELAAGTDGS